jgi:hypothetical protein
MDIYHIHHPPLINLVNIKSDQLTKKTISGKERMIISLDMTLLYFVRHLCILLVEQCLKKSQPWALFVRRWEIILIYLAEGKHCDCSNLVHHLAHFMFVHHYCHHQFDLLLASRKVNQQLHHRLGFHSQLPCCWLPKAHVGM